MNKRPVNEMQADDVEESPRMAETSQNLDETIVRALRQTPGEDESANDSGYERGLELVRAIGRDWSLGTPPSDATEGAGEPFEQTVTAAGSGPISKGGDDGPLGNIRDYRLLEKLGEGGMGAVYKALQTKLEKVVALKVLPAERLQDEAAVARFEREMKAVGRLDHPNIVRATDAGEHEGQHFLVMEYVDGVDLSQHVKQHGSLSIDDAIEVTRQTANALQYAHERGLVHRDVKPSNVMLASDSQASIRRQPADDVGRSSTLVTDHRADAQCSPVVKLLDLGLARLETEAAAEAQTRDELTTEGSVMGTVDYMSPEQALDTHNADARSDVYSLGCTLYFLLTGKPPFSGKTMMERLVAHREAPIPRIDPASIRRQPADDVERSNTLASDHRADAQCSPDALQNVLDRMLAKDPGERFQTMANVVAALDAIERPTVDDDATLAETFEIDSSFVAKPQAAAGRTSAVRKSLIAGGIVTTLLIAAVIVFKFKTRNGTLVIEVDDPKNVVVEIDGEKADGAKITADGKAVQLSIAPGTRQLVVKTADGTVLKVDEGKQVEIVAGKERRIRARVESTQVPHANSGRVRPLNTIQAANSKQAHAHQAAWAKRLKSPVTRQNSIGMDFQLIPPGEFDRGAPKADSYADDDERPRHRVKITRPFFLGKYEVSVGQFRKFVEATRYRTVAESSGKGSFGVDRQRKKFVMKPEWTWKSPGIPSSDSHPVVHVTFEDCRAFCRWLSKKEGRVYRLPTEAEWEYACRAGTTTRFYWGDNLEAADSFAWTVDNAKAFCKTPGQKSPNAWGLHEMHGNVAEWCLDYYAPYKTGPQTDPIQLQASKKIVTRGGACGHKPAFLRSSDRGGATLESRSFINGFRIVREIPRQAK